jgi:catechol 2,3-dioxygenase-like lactoylglutathione lyase family enzyme
VLTRIDHVMIAVPDLTGASETYTHLGFLVHAGGIHPGQGTHNAIAFHQEDYLELLGVRDRAEYLAASPDGGLLPVIDRGGGLRYVAVQSDDLAADVAAMRARGVDVADPAPGERRTPAGQHLRWVVSRLGSATPLPIFFIQHLTPLHERRRQVPRPGHHPNGVQRLERAYIAVPDVAAAARTYAPVLGTAVPPIQRGTVIKADMAVFDLGPTGLTIAQPVEPGAAAEALERQGPGPFQVLYRTSSMDAAARWLADHGVPPPTRGVRNTGEHAMLVDPRHACGVSLGLVGPA